MQNIVSALQTLLDHTDCYLYIKDMAGRYLYVNHTAKALFSRELSHLIGQDELGFFDLKPIADEQRVWALGESITQEETYPLINTDQVLVFWTNKTPYKNLAGEIIGI